MEAYAKLKVAELRDELKNRGLVTTGTKQVLLDRLQEHLSSVGDVEAPSEAAAPATGGAEGGPAVVNGEGGTNGAEAELAVAEESPEPAAEGPEEGGVAPMSEEERKLLRAQRFGMITKETVEDKKRQRAARFGIPLPEDQKRADRAKRFGLPLASDEKKKPALDKPLKAQKSKQTEKSEMAKKLEERAQRFGTGSVESSDFLAKKKARAERFKQ